MDERQGDARGGRVRRPDPGAAAGWEVEHHLAELVDRLVNEGMKPEDAAREAERRFGDPARYRDLLRSEERKRRRKKRRIEWWDVVVGTLARFGRTLRRSPAFATAVMLTLALGVGANATMFGILDRLLFRPPEHVTDPGSVRRIVVEQPPSGRPLSRVILSYPDYLDLQGAGAFEAVAAYREAGEVTLGSGADATHVRQGWATWDLFPLLGVRAERGRFYTKEEDRPGASLTVVVSHEYWRSRMGSDPGVLGRTLDIDGASFTIVGVAPPGFTGIDLALVDVWVPLAATDAAERGSGVLESRNFTYVRMVARLAPDVGPGMAEDAATAMLLAGRQEGIDAGRYSAETRVSLAPLVAARAPGGPPEAKVARWLGGVSLLVLLIACANVANLLLAHGTRRRRETAVHLALGVGRTRLVATMVGEAVLLALAGGAGALLLALWGGGFLRRVLLPGVFFPTSPIGGRVALFTLAIAAVAGLIAGVGPALRSTRADLVEELPSGAGAFSERPSRVRALLTVLQAAVSVVLLVGAGLFVHSVHAVRGVDLGLDVDRLLYTGLEFETGAFAIAASRGEGPDAEARERLDVQMAAMERVRKLAGVDAVAGTNFGWGSEARYRLTVPGLDSIPQLPGGGPYIQAVTPSYLRTVGLQVTSGRDLESSDDAFAPRVAVISETMAHTLWPHEDPLGRCLVIMSTDCTTVVGVTQDASMGEIESEPFMQYYVPLAQWEGSGPETIYVRTSLDPSRLAGAVATALRGTDPRIRFAMVRPLRDELDPQTRAWTLGATMFTLFGLLALAVAAIGLYSVLAFDVARRTRELGIRLALGARRRRLLARVVARGALLASFGVALGLAVALVAAPYGQDLLFHTAPRDPIVFSGVTLILLGISVLAGVAPGLRATRVDPLVALRTE